MVQRKSFNLNLTRTARRLSGARRVAMTLLVMLLTTATAWAEDNVSYRYYDNDAKVFKDGTANSWTVITDQTTEWGTANTETWYVVNSDVTISDRITTAGNVHLILTDGYTLTAGKGITVNSGNSLTIYGQANGTDTLYAGTTNGTDETADSHEAGIGGNTNGNGTITIDGGTVYAKGGTYSAGIGSGCNINSHNDCGTVIIHGGTVTATGGSYSAGIGGAGDRSNTSGTGGTIEITGGTVVANSGYSGAGIGGSGDGAGGTITISGGTVTANAKGWGAGIGGGTRAAGGNIEITGGIIYASSSDGGSGVGKGRDGSDEGTNVTKTSGVIFEGNSGQVYGTSFTLAEDLTIPEGKILTIPEGTTLIVPENVTLTNNGTIANNGTVDNDGTLTNAGALTNSGTIDNSGTATNTGTYSGNLITGNGTATNFIIDMTVTAENVNTTYDGQEHQITVNVSNPASGATITYCETETGTYTSTNPTYTDVCVKTVYYKVTASGYSDYYGSATVTINQKDLTVTANNHTISYGDAPANNGVTYSGFIEGEGQSVLSGTLTYAYKTNNDGTGNNYIASSPVGTYYIIPGGLTAANYAITFAAGTLTVGPKPTLTDAISYIDENGESKSKTAGSVYILAGTEQVLGVDGTETWYVCNTAATANSGKGLSYTSGLTLYGNVHLILADGCKMTVTNSSGNAINSINEIAIHGQSTGNNAGSLIAEGSQYGINATDNITISGGQVTASGTNQSGINSQAGTAISINSCIINATGANYGIYASGNITISGGQVTASGTNQSGINSQAGTAISINSCIINATGANYGIYGSCSEITISGGTVIATGTSDGGIYCGRGKISITDCNVTATGGSYGIYASGIITISGEKVEAIATGTSGNGIYTGADIITITDCEVTATGGSNGIRGGGDVTITRGKVEAVATSTNGNGIYTEAQKILITDCEVIVTGGSNGIKVGTDVTINGGKVTANGTSGSGIESGSASNISITDCEVNAEGGNNGIKGGTDVTINGGKVTANGTSGSGIESGSASGINITGCEVNATGGSYGIKGGSAGVTISGGKVEAKNTGDTGYGIYSGINGITLGWTNATDYICANSYATNYNGPVKTTDGQRFVAYTPSGTLGTEGFDPSSTGTTPSAFVSGSSNDSNPTFTLDAIAGKTLKPFEGYVVSIEDENISIMDGESVKTADFTITKGTGDEAVTVPYYIYEASTEANPVTVTLSYSGDLVTLGGLPEGTTLNAVEGQAMQRSFTMPATDVALTATAVTGLTATAVTYDGSAQTPVIKQGDDDFADTNYTIAYKLGNAEVTAADVKDANTYTCTLTGLGQYVGTASVDFTINKADYHEPDEIQNITKYVPSDKAGRFTIALPPLPDGATYSFTKTDASGLIATLSDGGEVTELTFTTNSGTTAGTTAEITVTATGAPNYNNYSFKVNVTVSEYTVAYAWPEQTSIWLDADNELAWAEDGVTLDRSKLTVKKGSTTITNYTAKVGNTELTDGENTLPLEPDAHRISITSADGKLDDWVDFKVIKLVEDADVFSVNVDDCYWGLDGGDHGDAVDTPPTNTATLFCNGQELEYSTDTDLNEFLSAYPGLTLWFEDNDHTPGNTYVSRIFTLNGLSDGDFYNMPEPVLEYRGLDYLGNLGTIVAAGSDDQRVFLPHGMNFKQLMGDDDLPVPASSAGGTIYYLCVDPPALHYVETEGANGMEWALYNGNTPVPENHYFRDSENNVYYGNGSAYTHYNASSTNGNFISFTPISYVVHGGPGNWNMDNIKVDPDNDYKFSYYCYFKWQNCDLDGDYFELVGKDFVILDGGLFFYTGDIVPEVVDGNKIRIGDSFIRSVDKDSNPDHTPIVWLRNATIADLIGEERNCPSAYAKYKVDDYHYQVASDSFLIYPNNSLVDIAELASVSKVGEDVTCKVVLHGPKTAVANVFLNGEWYTRLEGTRSHELTITGLHEGKYTIDVFGDGDDYVTPYHTNASFTVVKNDPVLTITGTTPAGAAFVNGGEIEYDPEKPVIITVANDAAVSGTSWKWTISDTDVVTQDHIVNESGENAVNRESIYLNTVGLGEVTVTARFSGNELYNPARKSITFTVAPLMTTLFAANTTNQWMTWCNAYAWTLPEGCNAYTINSVSGTTVTLNEVTAEGNASVIIPAYTPVLIQRETIGDDAVMAEFSAVGTAPETGYNSETGLVTSTGTGFTFYGNAGNTKFTDDGETKYVHTIEEYDGTQSYVLRGGIFLKIDKDEGIAAHRCWLNVSAESSNAARLNIVIGDGDVMGITTTDYTDFTDSEGAWYSLDGRKLDKQPTKKGLYIHGGRKEVIR